MIEDELRSLLADRAEEVPDNAARVSEVHTRIGAIRRRRAAATTLALVLVVAAGVLFTRLPGKPETLPAGVPAGPYFDQLGRPKVPGYQYLTSRQLDGPRAETVLGGTGRIPVPWLLVVRCERQGTLVARNVGRGDPSVTVTCSRPVSGGFEGATLLEPDEAGRLAATTDAVENVRFEPSNSGRWTVGVLSAIAPDRLPVWGLPGRPLLDGADGPAGGTVTLTIPPRPRLDPEEAELYGFGLTADCVAGVELALSVPTGPLATLACDQEHGLTQGVIQTVVPLRDMARLGLRPGDRVRLTVRSTGRQTDQWRLWRPDR